MNSPKGKGIDHKLNIAAAKIGRKLAGQQLCIGAGDVDVAVQRNTERVAYTGRRVTHLFYTMKVMVILCCILWCCASCTFDFDEPGVCPYNVRLNYRYAGRPDAGQLSMYVDNIHQFLFDEDGVLKDTRLLKADSLEHWQGELYGKFLQSCLYQAEPDTHQVHPRHALPYSQSGFRP